MISLVLAGAAGRRSRADCVLAELLWGGRKRVGPSWGMATWGMATQGTAAWQALAVHLRPCGGSFLAPCHGDRARRPTTPFGECIIEFSKSFGAAEEFLVRMGLELIFLIENKCCDHVLYAVPTCTL